MSLIFTSVNQYQSVIMRDSRPHPIIDSLFFRNDAEPGCIALLNIQQRAIMLLKLNREVSALLPAALRPWCRVANIRQDVIILETSNASWQMRLRYEQCQLLSALKVNILPSLSSVDIKINPSLAIKHKWNIKHHQMIRCEQQLSEENTRKLSLKSAVSIRCVVSRSEGKLKTVLERLADLAVTAHSSTRRK